MDALSAQGGEVFDLSMAARVRGARVDVDFMNGAF
jgi:hypothetical protein